MPRAARKNSGAQIYHVMLRGINKENIFQDSSDYKKFLQCIFKAKEKSDFEIYAYCLMTNHVHILIKNGEEELGNAIRRIAGTYAMYFNNKYDRIGHFFQDRYKSEIIMSNRQFLTVLRYIHQNPIKAGLVKSIAKYPWSSYHEYFNNNNLCIVDKSFVLEQFPGLNGFEKFITMENDDLCLDCASKMTISDKTLLEIISIVSDIGNLQNMSKAKRDEELKRIIEKTGASNRQLSRVLNIGRGILDRVK